MKKIKLFEMFAGYGGASFGLKKAGIPFESVGFSEIDKYAIQCYNQNHKGKNYGDCSKIDPNDLPDFNLLTGGFPCQDVSIAGNRDLSKGRTNLYLEVLRVAESKKPKYILLENVKGLLSMEINDRKLHLKIVSDLQKLGYGVVWKVLNSKNYGTPQYRERVWFVCKLGGWDFMEFIFPEKEELNIKLKDVLEDESEVDKKYILTKHQLSFVNYKAKQGRGEFLERRVNQIPNYSKCLKTGSQKKYVIEATLINTSLLSSKKKDVNQAIELAKLLSEKNKSPMQLDIYHLKSGEIRPLSTYIPQDFNVHRCLQSGKPKEILIFKDSIRVLTPKECFRLMGFFDDKINLEELSDTQCYRLAGNGWDINVVSKIFKKMFA